MQSAQQSRLGLRLLELEIGLAENVEATSPELVDYETSRIAGQAARLAMLIKGQDVIEDERRLRKIAAGELKISGPSFDAVKRFLQEVDLVEERTLRNGKTVLNEKIERINHPENYRRIGDLWLHQSRTHKEEALIRMLDAVVEQPAQEASIEALRALKPADRQVVVEVGTNASVIDIVDPADRRLFFSPLLWDVNPQKLAAFLKKADATAFATLLDKTRAKPGLDLTNTTDGLTLQAMSGGILPSYRVTSTAGERVYSFAPYTGALLTNDEERTILDKARAIVACVRYGGEAASITRLKNPVLTLQRLMDSSRGYKIGPHSELKRQYGMLVMKQIGRVVKEAPPGRFFYFELIPTPDNLRACRIAIELLSAGELVAHKDPAADFALVLAAEGTVGHSLHEVRVAKKKRPARSDELADLVDSIRTV